MAGSITTDGLVCAWNLTGQSAGVQSIAGAHGTAYALQMGSTAGVDGDDPAFVTPSGLILYAAGADDYCQALTVPDTDMLGEVTVIWVGRVENNILMSFVSKFASPGTENTNVPLYFKTSVGGKLQFRRANAGGNRTWEGPLADHLNFQFLAVTAPAAMETAPEFWIGKRKSTGSAISGSGTGPPTGNAGKLRMGSDGALPGAGTYSYLLIYSRILTDDEIGLAYDYLEALFITLGGTLKGVGSHMMTSNVLPSPQVASASSGNAWSGFDNSSQIGNYWNSATAANEWLQLDLGAGKLRILGSYAIRMYDAGGPLAPKDWTVSGSLDGVAWVVLDTVTNQTGWVGAIPGEIRTFQCDTYTTSYRYFRITVSANNGGATIGIGEWWLYEYVIETAPAASDKWLPLMGVGA